MTYAEATAYLESLVNFEHRHQPQAMRAVRLERMAWLCRRLGEPQRRFRTLLVAGTNGKGSICAMLYAMLRTASRCVGLYTSPHLVDPRERIRIAADPEGGADWLTEEEFATLVSECRPVFETLGREDPGGRPTYFEAMTTLALLAFARRPVEFAVLEVGLGGRLDATNVVEPSVAVFGSIGLDHAEVLGDDPARIAVEKAGIIKPRQTVISVPQQPEVAQVIRKACAAQHVPCWMAGEDFSARIVSHTPGGLEVSLTGLRGLYEHVEIPLLGRHQADNAAAAVAALEALAVGGIPHGIVARGLAQTAWPGRIELVSDAPVVILDGAHNPPAARALRSTVEELWPGRPVHLVLGMSADKPAEALGRILGSWAASVTCTQSRHPRALGAQELAERLAGCAASLRVIREPVDAHTYLLNTVSANEIIVVTGSLFVVGELRAALERDGIEWRRPSLSG